MSRNYNLCCKETKEYIWIGQGNNGTGYMDTLYSDEEHTMEELTKFFNRTKGYDLVLMDEHDERLQNYKEIEIRKSEIKQWKGTDRIKIKRLGETEWTLIEHRKNKSTGNINIRTHIISLEQINDMRKYCGEFFEYLDKINAKTLFREIINRRKLSCGVEAFNGGVNRAKYYFPLYYYPLKILESTKEIVYGGHGVISKGEKWKEK